MIPGLAETKKLIVEADQQLDRTRALLERLPQEVEARDHIKASLVAIKASGQRVRPRRGQREAPMGIIPAPQISEQDYPAFQMLLGGQIPASFEEWKRQAEKEDSLVGVGDSIKRIPVTPQDFIVLPKE